MKVKNENVLCCYKHVDEFFYKNSFQRKESMTQIVENNWVDSD